LTGDTLDKRAVREWGQRYSNWGRFGPGDELGTLNFITPARVLAAAGLVRSGLVVSCAPPPEARELGVHGARWQPLARVAYGGRVYNDRDPASLPAHGASAAAIDRLAGGITGRAVLLDLAHVARRPWLDHGTRIQPQDLDVCAEALGVTVDTGDILLLRTGRMARCFADPSWQGYASAPAPGLSVRCARWLYEREVAAVACDAASVEAQPAETRDCEQPLQQIAARDIGLWFGTGFHLDPLAEACAADGRYAFLRAAPILPSRGGLGAPIHPIAIK
jgi:kynurenine formamidase